MPVWANRRCARLARTLLSLRLRGEARTYRSSIVLRATPVRDDVPSHKVAEEAKVAKLNALRCNFCKRCGAPMELAIPEGEDELRHVCSNSNCGFVDYHNPKMVVGCLIEHEGEVLLCKRALEPCKGLWTLPAGYLELGESTLEGALRETWEEACARVDVVAPYAHLDIPVIGQTYLFFRGSLAPPYKFSAGAESEDVRLFRPADIPFDDLAFSSIHILLKRWVADNLAGTYTWHHGRIQKKAGASVRDPDAFTYVEEYATEWTA